VNEGFAGISTRPLDGQGEVVHVKEMLENGRAFVSGRGDEERICLLSDALQGVKLSSGDSVLMESKSGLLLEKLPRPEVEELLLEEVPDVSYDDVGGLHEQIEHISDAVELPFLHVDLFNEYGLPAPKGILLYGPPGCGKTLIAKAVANSLSKKVAKRIGKDKGKSYFINIKGPELLNKYVGETERQIRLIFQRAREKSEEGWPVVVFFDEMDSMFRTRGTGISSDIESTIVPQLLAEIDGVESLRNVIVIGATNREDLIDPAILRPGRLDVKIKIERPNVEAAKQIFARYLVESLPIDEEEIEKYGSKKQALEQLVESAATRMYCDSEENKFLEVTYQSGEKETLYYKDFSSGAMIENIVRRAKKNAIKRFLLNGSRGVAEKDLFDAVAQEFKEHEDLPNTTNPDDWAKISGKKGEKIIFIRTLVNKKSTEDGKGGKAIERVATGQYL
jgi:proteasome-associated ATPase